MDFVASVFKVFSPPCSLSTTTMMFSTFAPNCSKGLILSSLDSPSLTTSSRKSTCTSLATSAPAILQLLHIFFSFLTTVHGKPVRQPMLANNKTPFTSIEASLSILVEAATQFIVFAAMPMTVQRCIGEESRHAMSMQ